MFTIIGLSIFISVLIIIAFTYTKQGNSFKNTEPVGPRGNVPLNTPNEDGFKMFAIVSPGLLSRSAQPSLLEFQWLKDNNWKSVIDLRINGDHGQVGGDMAINGFSGLGFKYLWLQMIDGGVPTDEQALQFLSFVTNPNNQPVEIHCLAGIGRTGTMVALYRYQIQGWVIDQAIKESKLYAGGINSVQEMWLRHWATEHPH